MNVLRHKGIVRGIVGHEPTRCLDMPSSDCFCFSEDDGLIETMVDLGERVERGQVIARIHSVHRTGQAPIEIKAKLSGILAGRHFPGLVKSGDCLSAVAVPIS
jgi:N-alpha-acetyl-L-2,4-diaminobutyrate deacetylase